MGARFKVGTICVHRFLHHIHNIYVLVLLTYSIILVFFLLNNGLELQLWSMHGFQKHWINNRWVVSYRSKDHELNKFFKSMQSLPLLIKEKMKKIQSQYSYHKYDVSKQLMNKINLYSLEKVQHTFISISSFQ